MFDVFSACINRSRVRYLMHMEVYRMESDPLLDAYGSRPVSKPTRHDRSVGDIVIIWSRIVGAPSEKIVDRSKDNFCSDENKYHSFRLQLH
jgi:hypothetical protein